MSSSKDIDDDKSGDNVRKPWTHEEDEMVRKLVQQHGTQQWTVVASHLPGRTGKQCRERWHNQLDNSIKKDAWTPEEEQILLEGHKIHGNKWAEIAKMLPGRTDNAVKNHWHCALRRELRRLNSKKKLQSSDMPPPPQINSRNCGEPGILVPTASELESIQEIVERGVDSDNFVFKRLSELARGTLAAYNDQWEKKSNWRPSPGDKHAQNLKALINLIRARTTAEMKDALSTILTQAGSASGINIEAEGVQTAMSLCDAQPLYSPHVPLLSPSGLDRLMTPSGSGFHLNFDQFLNTETPTGTDVARKRQKTHIAAQVLETAQKGLPAVSKQPKPRARPIHQPPASTEQPAAATATALATSAIFVVPKQEPKLEYKEEPAIVTVPHPVSIPPPNSQLMPNSSLESPSAFLSLTSPMSTASTPTSTTKGIDVENQLAFVPPAVMVPQDTEQYLNHSTSPIAGNNPSVSGLKVEVDENEQGIHNGGQPSLSVSALLQQAVELCFPADSGLDTPRSTELNLDTPTLREFERHAWR